MGQTVGTAISDSDKKKEVNVVEQLRSYQRMISAKLEAEREKISKEAFNDTKLPILSLVSTTQDYRLAVTAAPKDRVGEILDSVVGGGYIKGLKGILSLALDQLLGNVSVGESEKKESHVAFANNSLLRIDCYMYKYQFQSNGLISSSKNIFGYYIQVGVLDLIKVNPQIVLYELTSSVGDAKQLEEATKKLTTMASFTNKLYRVVTALQSHGDKRPSDEHEEEEEEEEEDEEEEEEEEGGGAGEKRKRGYRSSRAADDGPREGADVDKDREKKRAGKRARKSRN